MTDARHTPVPGSRLWRENHHRSCAPSDLVLVWHCDQCGRNEPAEELALADELAEAVEYILNGYGPPVDVSLVREGKRRLRTAYDVYQTAMGRK